MTGTVTDPSGAVVPAAKVTVTSEGTQTSREVITGSTGIFAVPNLSVGSYRMVVAAAGFAPYDRGGITLSANQVLNADVKLALMQAGSTVQVTDTGAAISTETTNISNLRLRGICSNCRSSPGMAAIRVSTPTCCRIRASTACPETVSTTCREFGSRRACCQPWMASPLWHTPLGPGPSSLASKASRK
ncbi:MAG: carboxypeptidase regulatory-like domain-containing protein [Bryobacterales bacterium]|nr:carboxypeptidase regulatory-like domain-containing protein [Bryobacterales bacterium]